MSEDAREVKSFHYRNNEGGFMDRLTTVGSDRYLLNKYYNGYYRVKYTGSGTSLSISADSSHECNSAQNICGTYDINEHGVSTNPSLSEQIKLIGYKLTTNFARPLPFDKTTWSSNDYIVDTVQKYGANLFNGKSRSKNIFIEAALRLFGESTKVPAKSITADEINHIRNGVVLYRPTDLKTNWYTNSSSLGIPSITENITYHSEKVSANMSKENKDFDVVRAMREKLIDLIVVRATVEKAIEGIELLTIPTTTPKTPAINTLAYLSTLPIKERIYVNGLMNPKEKIEGKPSFEDEIDRLKKLYLFYTPESNLPARINKKLAGSALKEIDYEIERVLNAAYAYGCFDTTKTLCDWIPEDTTARIDEMFSLEPEMNVDYNKCVYYTGNSKPLFKKMTDNPVNIFDIPTGIIRNGVDTDNDGTPDYLLQKIKYFGLMGEKEAKWTKHYTYSTYSFESYLKDFQNDFIPAVRESIVAIMGGGANGKGDAFTPDGKLRIGDTRSEYIGKWGKDFGIEAGYGYSWGLGGLGDIKEENYGFGNYNLCGIEDSNPDDTFSPEQTDVIRDKLIAYNVGHQFAKFKMFEYQGALLDSVFYISNRSYNEEDNKVYNYLATEEKDRYKKEARKSLDNTLSQDGYSSLLQPAKEALMEKLNLDKPKESFDNIYFSYKIINEDFIKAVAKFFQSSTTTISDFSSCLSGIINSGEAYKECKDAYTELNEKGYLEPENILTAATYIMVNCEEYANSEEGIQSNCPNAFSKMKVFFTNITKEVVGKSGYTADIIETFEKNLSGTTSHECEEGECDEYGSGLYIPSSSSVGYNDTPKEGFLDNLIAGVISDDSYGTYSYDLDIGSLTGTGLNYKLGPVKITATYGVSFSTGVKMEVNSNSVSESEKTVLCNAGKDGATFDINYRWEPFIRADAYLTAAAKAYVASVSVKANLEILGAFFPMTSRFALGYLKNNYVNGDGSFKKFNTAGTPVTSGGEVMNLASPHPVFDVDFDVAREIRALDGNITLAAKVDLKLHSVKYKKKLADWKGFVLDRDKLMGKEFSLDFPLLVGVSD